MPPTPADAPAALVVAELPWQGRDEREEPREEAAVRAVGSGGAWTWLSFCCTAKELMASGGLYGGSYGSSPVVLLLELEAKSLRSGALGLAEPK